MLYMIIGIKWNGEILEYPELMNKAFGEDLELAADWINDISESCPVEFTIATIKEM